MSSVSRFHLAFWPFGSSCNLYMCCREGYANSALNFIIPVSDLPACVQAGLDVKPCFIVLSSFLAALECNGGGGRSCEVEIRSGCLSAT